MKKFSLKKNTEKIKKLRSELVLKHGAYNTALIAIVAVAVLVVNIIATAVVGRFPLSIDLSSTGENTISRENVEYIKGVEKPVNIVVCATEEGYTGGYLAQYAYYYHTAEDSSGEYYMQTLKLLSEYEKYNKNIELVFADPDAASFSPYQAIVPDKTLQYGDILVYSTFKNDEGEETTNARVIGYTDIYSLSDPNGYAAYGYGTYTVSGSNVETAVTSAIYSVTSEESKVVGVLSGHGTAGAFDALSATLKINNYEIVDISDAIITSIPENVDMLVLAGPSTDFAASEIAVIDAFLENGGKRGKNMAVFCDAKSANMPNLYAFLAEWGADVQTGSILFETDETNYLSGMPTTMGFENAATDYTKAVNEDDKIYIAGNNLPMTAAYTTYGTRTANVLMTTLESVVAAPVEADATWTPDSSFEKQEFATVIYTTDSMYDDDNNLCLSGMLVFSSTDLISSTWEAYTAVGNSAYALAAFNAACGKDTNDISFVTKTISEYAFTQPTEASVSLVGIVFTVLLPVALMVCGVIVWYRRKNR